MKQAPLFVIIYFLSCVVAHTYFGFRGVIVSTIILFTLFSAYEIYRLYRIKRYKFKVYVVDDEGNVEVHRFKTKEGAIKFLHIMEIKDVNAYIGD